MTSHDHNILEQEKILRRVEDLGDYLRVFLWPTNNTPQHTRNCVKGQKALKELMTICRTALTPSPPTKPS